MTMAGLPEQRQHTQHNKNDNDDEKEPEAKDDEKKKETIIDKAKGKCSQWASTLFEDLKKDKLWQHILKCSIATLIALATCLIRPVAYAYGPAVFLSAISSVFGHPGRTLGAMFETLVFALVGTLIGCGWVTFASFVSDRLYQTSNEDSHAFRAVILVISFMVHGYLRSAFPKFFVGILLFLIAVIIQMTTPVFTFNHVVATAFLYPFLTGLVACTLVNVIIFPEFSSGIVAVKTVNALNLALDTLNDATDFFGCDPLEPQNDDSNPAGKPESSQKVPAFNDKDSGKKKDKDGKPGKEEEKTEEKKEDPLKKLVAAKDKLRKALEASKAVLKETSYEISFACIPPAKLRPISSRGLEHLVMSLLTLIGACETKHIVLGPEGPRSEADDKDDDESDKNSLKERIESIRPKREAEVADEEFLRHLLERVNKPLVALRATVQDGMHALIACIELSSDVPVTKENRARKPEGIPLKEIDIYANAIESALDEFDKRTREALHLAAEEASEQEEVEFDTLPREEIFLVSSFLLNLRLAAEITLDMLKEGRDLVEEYDELKGKRSFHLPDFRSKKWLRSGGPEKNEALEVGDQKNVTRYRQAAGNAEAANKRALSNATDSGRTSATATTDKKKKKTNSTQKRKEEAEKKEGKTGASDNSKEKKKDDKAEEEEKERKPLPTRIRDWCADFVDWIMTSSHLHYALKLTFGGMLLGWPAFVQDFEFFFYNFRGVWVTIIYVLVFEDSVGTSVQVFAYRTVGTVAGSLWGYASWSAGSGNPYVIAVMLYFGFLIGFYVQLNTRYVKAGMVLTISMVVVAVGTEIEYIPGSVPGTALENFLKRSVAMIIGGLGALIIQTVLFPVQARVKLVETVGLTLTKINEMESALAFGVDQTTNISDLKNENAIKAFYKARKKADLSLAAASAYLSVTTKEPRIKGSFANDKLIYKEIIYVLHQIIDRMENVLQLRVQLGSSLLENYYAYVYKYRRNVAAAITITLFAVHEALTDKLPLPQYFPSARLAQLRMVNRVRQLMIESVSEEQPKGGKEAEDNRRQNLRVEFMTYNASSAALEQVIEWLEELVDLTKLLRGAAEFRFGLLSRPTYREWVRQISVGGEVQNSQADPKTTEETKEVIKNEAIKAETLAKKQAADAEVMEGEDGLPETLKRVQSRHREARAVRRASQSTVVLPEQVGMFRKAAKGLGLK